jgi:hypothetical protein
MENSRSGLTLQFVRSDIEEHIRNELLVFTEDSSQLHTIVPADMQSRLARHGVNVRTIGEFRYPGMLRDRQEDANALTKASRSGLT